MAAVSQDWKERILTGVGTLIVAGIIASIVTNQSLQASVASLKTQVDLLSISVDRLAKAESDADHDRYTAADARRDRSQIDQRFERDEAVLDALRYGAPAPGRVAAGARP